jgi:exopolysaccharide/PEP-CTERM locus tyrosine autokinase
MSLVEQAIARMRNQANAAKPKAAEARSNAASPVPVLTPLPEPTQPSKQMSFDRESLRALGYLPEQGKDRQFADNYRRIKRPLIDKALSSAVAGRDPRVIMVTSALPGDGKTFTSVNLALSMAQERDISVLLVDYDVAKRHISDIVGLRQDNGLMDALVDDSIDIESLVVQTDIRGLSVLPAGRRAESATELLSSNRMRQILAQLCARNPRRIVLLDSPPLLITNEGRALVGLAGQIVLVVRAGCTSRNAVQDAAALFDEHQAGGVILNHVAVSNGEGYYGYGSYGSYGAPAKEVDES